MPKAVIYRHWCDYAQSNGLHRLSNEQFFAALYAAAEGRVRQGKRRDGGRQVPSVYGIDLGTDQDADEELPF